MLQQLGVGDAPAGGDLHAPRRRVRLHVACLAALLAYLLLQLEPTRHYLFHVGRESASFRTMFRLKDRLRYE